MTTGYIYILSNSAMPGILKIGRTDRQPELRARELRTTGVPHPFTLEHYVEVENSALAEKQLHQRLQEQGARISTDREFFSIDLSEAISALNIFAKNKSLEPDFTCSNELAAMANAVPIPNGANRTPKNLEEAAMQIAAIARRGCPFAMKLAANLVEGIPSGPKYKQYWREYLELLRADVTRHLLASSNGRELRASVGRAAAEYVYICFRHRWLIDDDFEFLSSFLVNGDQFQYEGYLNELPRYKLPSEVLQRANEV